ncbi:MAG: Cof-type HAD-IIB family hydrolase [Firmicutes bacterium]|nr:Cof-type HAD-IIB family hydrolase [Bacillota bacterium]
MKKIVFIDIDGTLVCDKGQVSKRNVDAIKRIKDLGYIPVICTGRAVNLAKNIIELTKVDYMIFANGGGAYDCGQKKVIYQNAIDHNLVNCVCNAVKNDDIKIEYIANGNLVSLYMPQDTVVQINLVSYQADILPSVKQIIESYESIKIVHKSKFYLDDTFAPDGDPRTPDKKRFFYDVALKNTSKGSGIIGLCNILNIKKQDRIAIGDEFNDFKMFSECGFNVAMGNALPNLKKIADFITDTNTNDGVAQFLDTLN